MLTCLFALFAPYPAHSSLSGELVTARDSVRVDKLGDEKIDKVNSA